MLSMEEARTGILSAARPLVGTETIPLHTAARRILAAPVLSDMNVPPVDNSAMDGYAVRNIEQNHIQLPVSACIYAGDMPCALATGTAARIFTGAPIPLGADTVVMQENVSLFNDNIHINTAAKTGANIRRRGEDIQIQQVLFDAGHFLCAQDIGLLASVGKAAVSVQKKLRVGLLCTGDELQEPGTALEAGKIYNSNRYLLMALLADLGCEVVDAGMVRDDLTATKNALRTLAEKSDVLISTGGVSVGHADYVKTAVQSLGRLDVWKVAIKPRKPLAFGEVCGTQFFGLPGNPVSAFVTFLLFVHPFLCVAQGGAVRELRRVPVRATFAWPTANSREEYLRAQLHSDNNGALCAVLYPNQGSGVLSSVCWADALVRVPAATAFSLEENKTLDALLL